MKKSFLLILAVAGICFCSFAQANVGVDESDESPESVTIANKGGEKPKKTPEDRAKSQSMRMKQQLNLSQEQTDKVYKLALMRAQKMDQLKARSDADKKSKITQARQIQVENDLALKTDVLTPEQYTQYIQWKEDRKKQMKENKGQPVKKPRPTK